MTTQPHEIQPGNSDHSDSEELVWSLERGDKATNLAHLLELYNSGDTEAFNTELDDIAYDSLSEDRLFMNNIRRIHNPSTPRAEQESIRDAQRRIFETRKQAILHEIGISSNDEAAQFEEKREALRSRLSNANVSGTESEDEMLKVLGVIDTSDTGEEVFAYPTELFPEITNNKWDAYLGSVKNHIQKAREFGSGMLAKEDVELADRTRRVAHNAVSRDIDRLLGLDLLPESTWDFEKTRRLVVKMRQRRFPTIETAEKHVTTRAVALGLAAAAALAEKHRSA